MAKAPSWKAPLILSILLAVGGSASYWYEFKQKPKKAEKEQATKKIFPIKDTPIKSILLVDGDKRFVFNCTDDSSKLCKPGDHSQWSLSEPSQIRGDETPINSLLSALDSLTISETIDLSTETPEKRNALLTEYKLDPARTSQPTMRKVEIRTAKDAVYGAYFGDHHPIGDSIFTLVYQEGKIESTQVHLVASYFKNNFDKDLTHWRNKKIISLASSDVESFTLEGSHGKIQANKKDGQWTLNGELPGDIENIDSVLTAVTYLSAEKFAAENKESKAAKEVLQGSKPILTLAMKSQKPEEKPIALKLFEKKLAQQKDWKLYATVSNADPVFEMNSGVRNRIDKSLKDFRLTKLITSIERFTINRISLTGPGHNPTTTLSSQDGKWKDASAKIQIDSEKIQSLLDRISGNRIQEFLDDKKAPSIGTQKLEFSLGDDKNPSKRKWLVWRSGDKLYGKDLQSSRSEVVLIDQTVADLLPWDSKMILAKP